MILTCTSPEISELIIIYLSERETKWERRKERIFHPLVYFPKACQGLGEYQARVRSWIFNPDFLTGQQEPNSLSHHRYLPV